VRDAPTCDTYALVIVPNLSGYVVEDIERVRTAFFLARCICRYENKVTRCEVLRLDPLEGTEIELRTPCIQVWDDCDGMFWRHRHRVGVSLDVEREEAPLVRALELFRYTTKASIVCSDIITFRNVFDWAFCEVAHDNRRPGREAGTHRSLVEHVDD
jgi:hypothetical protein